MNGRDTNKIYSPQRHREHGEAESARKARQLFSPCSLCLCGSILFFAAVQGATAQSFGDANALVAHGLSAAGPVQRANAAAQDAACRNASLTSWPGLTIENGRVVHAAILDEIEGYARVADTNGGLGGRLYVVTSNADYLATGEAPVPGSLRSVVAQAQASHEPAWIVFSPRLKGQTIALKLDIRVPDNITIDGTCSGALLETAAQNGEINILSKHNVVVDRLGFHKTGYRSGPEDQRTALRVNGIFDRVAILHDDFSQCGDGCVDITVSPGKPDPERARITVAFNRFEDHDKVMLFGTDECGKPTLGMPACDASFAAAHRSDPPVMFLTLEGNVFLRTGQRHPRVFGRVMADIVNNVVANAPLPREGGGMGGTYGTAILELGRALVERNVYVPLAAQRPTLEVWTIDSKPGAESLNIDGFIRLDNNLTTSLGILNDHAPDEVPMPPYSSSFRPVPVEALGLDRAIACIAARAGRDGSSGWNRDLCG